MANYIKRSLEEDEEILLDGQRHWTFIFGYLFSSFMLLLAGIGFAVTAYMMQDNRFYYVAAAVALLSLIAYAAGALVRAKSEFVVTPKRFIQKDGILNITMTEIPLFKIETVNFYQSLWQRMLGTACIELVGSGGTSHQIHAIRHPQDARKAITSSINRKPETAPVTEKKD